MTEAYIKLLIEKYQITPLDLELERRKHNRSIFGNVPIGDHVLILKIAADREEAKREEE